MKTKFYSFRSGFIPACVGIAFFAVLGGCIPSREVLAYKELPLHNQVQASSYGAMAIVEGFSYETTIGELIAIDAERVYILQDNAKSAVAGQPRSLKRIKRSEIAQMDLIFARNPDGVQGIGALAYITLPSHLLYAFLTVPFNIVWMKATASYDRGAFRLNDITIDDAKKFARFPQGLPTGTTFEELKKIL
jgi:hypothetical protein